MTEIMLSSAPQSWPTVRLGQIFRERKEKVSDTEFPPLSVTKNGIVPQLETAAKSDAGDNRKAVYPSDFVINSRSDRKGSAGVSNLRGSVSLISIVLEPTKVDPAFAHHLLRSYAFGEEFYRWGHGIVADLWTTRWSDMKNIRLALPDLHTQKAIAAFLDRETARIDQLLEKKQRLVELLGEKSKVELDTLLFDTTTEGTLEWKGITVPRPRGGAKVRRLLHACSLLRDGTHQPPSRVDSGVPLLSVRNIINGAFVIREDDSHISEESYSDLCRSFVVKKGDVLLAVVGATLGKAAIVGEMPPFHVQRSLAVFRPRPNLLKSEYMLLYFRSAFFQSLLWENTSFSAQPGIYLATLGRLPIIAPSLSEQSRILGQWSELQEPMRKIEVFTLTSIDRLKEYRSALITAAVTGQIDVETWSRRGEGDRRLDRIEEEMAG